MKSHSGMFDTQGDNSQMIAGELVYRKTTLMSVLKGIALAGRIYETHSLCCKLP